MHALTDVDPAGESAFPGQTVQSDSAAAPEISEYLPAVQLVQAVTPSAEYLPASQSAQSEPSVPCTCRPRTPTHGPPSGPVKPALQMQSEGSSPRLRAETFGQLLQPLLQVLQSKCRDRSRGMLDHDGLIFTRDTSRQP